jgi:F0F1-type ATP synthase assembly protein I
MRKLIKDKRGGFTDLFLFMIIALVLLFTSGLFIYFGNTTFDKLHETLGNKEFGTVENSSEVIDDTFGAVVNSYQALYWIATMLIVGMVLSIFIGSYLVTTKPVFFIPYTVIGIVAIVVAVGISQSYETVIAEELLAETFLGFTGGNFIMSYLPIWVAVIGIVGAVIMFVRMGSKENEIYGGGGYYG